MAFFLIVPSVMIVSVLLVHALANRIGLRIYYTTLIAVVILSFMVTFGAATLTSAIGREFLLRLGLMILAASALLVPANKFLLKKQLAEEKRFDAEVKAAYEEEKKKFSGTAESKPIDKFKRENDDSFDAPPAYNQPLIVAADEKFSAEVETVDDKISAEVETVDDKISAEVETVDDKILAEVETVDDKILAEVETVDDKISAEVETVADDKISAEVETVADDKISAEVETVDDKILAEVEENPALPEDFPLQEVFKPLSEIKSEDSDKPLKLPEKPEEDSYPLENVFRPLSAMKKETIDRLDSPAEKNFERTELFPLQEVFKPLSTLNLEKLEEITREEKNLPHEEETTPEEKIDTLDDLLDKAYAERDKGNIWQAIETYKKAMERYHNDEYAPFVAIDLGNIYKEQALYSNAIKVYEEALTLPAVERNSATKKEFAATLSYLRVVHKILVSKHALSTPFNKLSKEILQEIDTEFQKVQINSAQ